MENLRNMISNLYIYQFQKQNENNNISLNKSNKSSRELSPIPMNNSIHNYIEIPKLKNENSKNKKINNLRSYSPNYNILPNDLITKQSINYITKNKELLKEKEIKMKEERLKKENEALNLLLNKKDSNKNYIKIQSRLYDYEQNQKKKKLVKIPKNNIQKIRSQSSEARQKIENNNNIIDQNSLKYYQNLGNIILPKIKPETSPINNEINKTLNNHINNKNNNNNNNDNNNNDDIIILNKKENEKKINKKNILEEEKKEKLKELTELKKNLEIEYFSLPIARLSKKQIERKGEIERNLNEIDNQMNKLSYKNIIIKI